MGLFSKKPRYVQVVYHDIAHRPPEGADLGAFSYSFRWELKASPSIGQWVWINGGDGPTSGVVASIGPPPRGIELSPVIGLIAADDWERFNQARAYNAWKKADDLNIWIHMARKKAGFAVDRELPARAPAPYETIPAIKGRVVGADAKDRGRIWWRLYNLAIEQGLPDAEIAKFKEIAEGWYERGRMKSA